MNVSASNSTAAAATAGAASTQGKVANKSLGKDQFLQLLVTQLRNQDPLNPMDSQAFVSQLAQFSSLEQLTNTNTKLESLLTYQSSLQNTLMSGLIGKDVSFSGNSVNLKGTAAISYNPSADAMDLKISIYDSTGKVVREIGLGMQTAGEKSYTWDGKDSNGKVLADGQYTVNINAVDSSGKSVGVSTKARGTVTGITYDGTNTWLVVDNGTKIQLGDVTEINAGGA